MFSAPKTKNELIKILSMQEDNRFLIAGGTDLIIKIKDKEIADYSIVDITKIDEFRHITDENDRVCIGATVTMTQLCENETIREEFYALYRAAYKLGSDQIRNRATIGGNIANASQSADTVLTFFAYDADVEILNPIDGLRVEKIKDVVVGKNKTTLKQNEVITRVILKRKDRVSIFNKVGARKAVTISKISCAMNFEVVDKKVKECDIYLGAVGIRPVKANMLENVFLGKSFEEVNLQSLQEASSEEIELAIPDRSSKNYKKVAIEGLVEDILKELIA